MVNCCVVLGCRVGYGKKSPPEGVSLHKLPPEDDKERRQQWINKIGRQDWTPSDNALVCSRHFTPDCFKTVRMDTNESRRKRRNAAAAEAGSSNDYHHRFLKDNAVPTIFPSTKNMKKKEFNDLGDELVILIMSYIKLPIDKIRLERVSKRFRACVRHKDSWVRNTKLDFWNDARMRESQLLDRFLSLAPKIDTLEFGFDLPDDEELTDEAYTEILAKIWTHGKKIELKRLTFMDTENSDTMLGSPELMVWILSAHASTLESVTFYTATPNPSAIEETLFKRLPFVRNLRQFKLYRGTEVAGETVIKALVNKPLESLHLENCETITGRNVAEILNSIPKERRAFKTLKVCSANPEGTCVKFGLAAFCERLEADVGKSIEYLDLIGCTGHFFTALAVIPSLFPKLSTARIDIFTDQVSSVTVAESIGKFLNAACDGGKQVSIYLTIRVLDTSQMVSDLWSAVNLLGLASGGTVRIAESHDWKRKVHKGNAHVYLRMNTNQREPLIIGEDEDQDEDEDMSDEDNHSDDDSD